jgi:enamine deaminase RidA (YjgF/YER057c/UK114 family)
MPIERLNPETLSTPQTYSQLVVAEGSRLVFVAGQVALDRDGNLVGGDDVGAQARQVCRNIRAALEAVGAGPEHIVKFTTLVVNHRPELLSVIATARQEELGDIRAASTLIGVQALARPEFLIEIEALAVLDLPT